jgi:hypothetical protein
MRLGEVSVSKPGLLSLIVPILLTTHGAQAAYSDYVVACATLLENLKADDSVRVPPYEGREAANHEIVAAKDLERWLQRNGGQLFRIDNGASQSKIFRWISPSGESQVIKAYFDKQDALKSDRQFRFLDHNLPVGLLETIPRTGKYRTLRFYKDVRGVTLNHLIKEDYYPNQINAEITRLYVEHLRAFKNRIIERYGQKKVREMNGNPSSILPDLRLEITTSLGHKIRIWIHDENILFDSTAKVFWIIDPE